MSDATSDLQKALTRTLEERRLVACFLGAGASAGAGVPTMGDIYKYLAQKVAEVAEVQSERHGLVGQVAEWLAALQQGNRSRTLAARTFSAFQETARSSGNGDSPLANIWTKFSKDFLSGKIGETSS